MKPLDVPYFLVRSTLACSMVINIILLPFFINALLETRIMLALLISLVLAACSINIWYGIKNQYNLIVNSYFLSPTSMVAITYAFYNLGIPGSYWVFVLLISSYFVLPEKRALLFTSITILIFIPAAWYILPHDAASRFVACLVITSLFITLSMREIYKLHYKLEEKVIHDPLTNLYNRSTLKIYLQQAIAQSKRSMMPMTLISLDIDHFKKINDRFGHDKGDEVLVNLSELLQNRIRESDRVFRMGGEEFLICLYNTEQSSSVKFAEALRKQVEQTLQLPEHPITISLGVADLEKDMDLHSWLKACDNNLYKAKHEGRNCVVA